LTLQAEIENRVVPGRRIQDAPHLLGIDSDGPRRLAGAIYDGWNHAAGTQPAGVILAATLPRLGFYVLVCCCCSHNLVLYKNNLLTEVSS
jgi:hypothetical protein